MLVSVAEVIRSWQCFDSGMEMKCSSQILRIGVFREEEASCVGEFAFGFGDGAVRWSLFERFHRRRKLRTSGRLEIAESECKAGG